jgi:sulfate adenylyltransferase
MPSDLLVTAGRALELRTASPPWRSWTLTPRQICDLELLMNGAFAPLEGFMTRRQHEAVCEGMRLDTGELWPIPVTLDVPGELASRVAPGDTMALRDPEGVMLAALHVEDVWQPDAAAEAEQVFGTASLEHPGVAELLQRTHPWRVGGRVEGVQLPVHYDYVSLRSTPGMLRREFEDRGWSRVVAFQTRNPMHRAHVELTLRAARDARAHLLLHPVVGLTKPGDVDHHTRVRCYRAVLAEYPPGLARLALLPLAMRMAGPREAVWHALIRRNHGCTHLIVGRDHAGPGTDSSGRPFYGPYDAQELLRRHEREIGVVMVPFRDMLYAADLDRYVPENEVTPGLRVLSLSGTELRRRLLAGDDIPGWFTFPAVAEELRRTYPPRHRQGLTIFFTGLSGAGKSTIANVLLTRLLERGGRTVTLLDGDIVRRLLSSELGYSKAHRDLNIRRIGFVASEVARSGGIAICAPIAPYDATRREVRGMATGAGGFVLVHVSTPLEVCEARDRKGLYAKARAGLIEHFTGISDPYEPPTDAEIVIDTTDTTPEAAADRILYYLEGQGYVGR